MSRYLVYILSLIYFPIQAQKIDSNHLDNRIAYLSLGTGPSTISGFSFMGELGMTHRKSTFAFKGDMHIQFWGTSGGKRVHDVFLDIALIYGHIIPREKFNIEINVGPIFYAYFDERLTTVNYFGSKITAIRAKEYDGFGLMLKTDIAKNRSKKVIIDYSGFIIVNQHLPIIGATANLKFRMHRKELSSKA